MIILLISMPIALFKVLSNNSYFRMKLYYQTIKTLFKQIIEGTFLEDKNNKENFMPNFIQCPFCGMDENIKIKDDDNKDKNVDTYRCLFCGEEFRITKENIEVVK